MENGRAHRFLSKRVTAWSKYTLPGWWTMFTVVAGAAFFLYLAYSLMAGHTPQKPPPPPAVSGPLTTEPSSTSTGNPTDPTSDSANPGDPASSSSSPVGTDQQLSVPAPAGEKLVKVYGPNGRIVKAPLGASQVATLAFEALYDTAAAAQVPTSSGAAHVPPATTGTGKVSQLTWTNPVKAHPSRLKFSAVVDPDGAQQPAPQTIAYATIARLSGHWVYLDSAS